MGIFLKDHHGVIRNYIGGFGGGNFDVEAAILVLEILDIVKILFDSISFVLRLELYPILG